jgi:hypothetical protein
MASTAVLVAAAALAAIPAASGADTSPPPFLGDWQVQGLGLLHVRQIGSRTDFRGTVVVPDPAAICLKPGREIWQVSEQLTGPPNNYRYGGGVEYFAFGSCDSIGFGHGRWDFQNPPDAGQLCGTAPFGGGGVECHNFSRVGAAVAPLSPWAIAPSLVSCLSKPAWFAVQGGLSSYLCNQVYYAANPGRLTTQVYLCTEFSNGFSFIYGHLPVCPGFLRPAGVLARKTGGKHKVKPLKLAKATLDFGAAGYGGVDIVPTKKGAKILRKAAKHHKKLPLTVVSTFKPTSGPEIKRAKHFRVKP